MAKSRNLTLPKKTKTPRNLKEQKLWDQLKRAKVPFEYEVKKLPYTLNKEYLPDFYLPKQDIYIEFKGYFRAVDRAKMAAVKKAHPHLDIRIVFQQADKKCYKGSKMTYADWAQKYGFPWSEGVIKKEWLK